MCHSYGHPFLRSQGKLDGWPTEIPPWETKEILEYEDVLRRLHVMLFTLQDTVGREDLLLGELAPIVTAIRNRMLEGIFQGVNIPVRSFTYSLYCFISKDEKNIRLLTNGDLDLLRP